MTRSRDVWRRIEAIGAAAVSSAALVVTTGTAVAQPSKHAPVPRVVCSNNGVCVVVGAAGPKRTGDTGSTGGSTCRRKGSVVPCSLDGATFDAADGCYHAPVDPATATGVVRKEFDEGGGSIVFASCSFGGAVGYLWIPPAKPVVTAEMVRERVARLVPAAALGIAPSAETLVNIQTVMWVDAPATQQLAPVQILGRRVLIRLSDPTVRYEFGDGATADDQPTGKAYTNRDPCRTRLCPDYYGHIYRDGGRDVVTARVHWHVTYTVDGGPSLELPGTVDGPRATAAIAVREARTVITQDP